MARKIRPRSAPPLAPDDPGEAGALGGKVLLGAFLLLVLPELVLVPADHGLWGSAAWRPTAYQNGAFWSGLLRDWRPNYALQPVLMFATYAFLHAGPGHLLGNALALVPLGERTARWLGPSRTLAVAAAAGLGGAAAFGLLSRDPAPMVGASGVVFGLAGALVLREGLGPGGLRVALALAAALALVNLATWALMAQVAWQTHAGGALAGAGAAWALRPRRARGGAGSLAPRATPQAAGPDALGEEPLSAADPSARPNTLS